MTRHESRGPGPNHARVRSNGHRVLCFFISGAAELFEVLFPFRLHIDATVCPPVPFIHKLLCRCSITFTSFTTAMNQMLWNKTSQSLAV